MENTIISLTNKASTMTCSVVKQAGSVLYNRSTAFQKWPAAKFSLQYHNSLHGVVSLVMRHCSVVLDTQLIN